MYRVDPVSGDIFCETAEEAVDLAAVITARSQPARKLPREASRPLAATSLSDADRQRRMAKQALAFLEAVKDAGENGIGGKKLADKIGCNGINGIGTTVQNVNRFLMAAKLSFANVAVKTRVGDEKLWMPGKQIAGGVKALQGQVSELTAVVR